MSEFIAVTCVIDECQRRTWLLCFNAIVVCTNEYSPSVAAEARINFRDVDI